jgi:hypothetical protein
LQERNPFHQSTSIVTKAKDSKTYKDLPIKEDVLIEILMDAKKKELEIALSKIPDSADIILWSKNKH